MATRSLHAATTRANQSFPQGQGQRVWVSQGKAISFNHRLPRQIRQKWPTICGFDKSYAKNCTAVKGQVILSPQPLDQTAWENWSKCVPIVTILYDKRQCSHGCKRRRPKANGHRNARAFCWWHIWLFSPAFQIDVLFFVFRNGFYTWCT